MTAGKLAGGIWSDKQRAAECTRYYKMIIDALNATHDANNQQDALALFEALAMVIGQLTGSMAVAEAIGVRTFISDRAIDHGHEFAMAGKSARYFIDGVH